MSRSAENTSGGAVSGTAAGGPSSAMLSHPSSMTQSAGARTRSSRDSGLSVRTSSLATDSCGLNFLRKTIPDAVGIERTAMSDVEFCDPALQQLDDAAPYLGKVFGVVMVIGFVGAEESSQVAAHQQVAGNGLPVVKDQGDGSLGVSGSGDDFRGDAVFAQREAFAGEDFGCHRREGHIHKRQQDAAEETRWTKRGFLPAAQFARVAGMDGRGDVVEPLERLRAPAVVGVSVGVQDHPQILQADTRPLDGANNAARLARTSRVHEDGPG